MSQPLPFPPPPWRQHLLALPDVEPTPALWSRLAAARRAAARRRRQPLRLGLAAALALVAVLALLGRETTPVAPQAAAPAPLAAAAVADAGLRRLDDQIALAYAQGAADEELAVLWQTRAQLIESLQGPAPAVLARL